MQPPKSASNDHTPYSAPNLENVPQDERISEISQKKIRYGAMAAIALATGVMAFQGVIGITVITAAVILSTYGIQARAENLFFLSSIETATKVQTIANARFWSQTILASTMAGLTGAIAVLGSLAFTIDHAVFKSMLLQLIAWTGLAPCAQDSLAKVAKFGNDPTLFIEKFTFLSDRMTSAYGLNPTLPAFLLKQYLKIDLETGTLKAEALFPELEAHQNETQIAFNNYFDFFDPILDKKSLFYFIIQNTQWLSHLPSDHFCQVLTDLTTELNSIQTALEDPKYQLSSKQLDVLALQMDQLDALFKTEFIIQPTFASDWKTARSHCDKVHTILNQKRGGHSWGLQ